MGPILWQLPPNLGFHPEKLETFFNLLPRTTHEAAELARTHHDHRLKAAPFAPDTKNRPLRYALEVRHETFCCQEYIDLLRRASVASVVSDSAGRFPVIDDVTADFVYVRLHGHQQLYSGGYPESLLNQWASRAVTWARGKQISTEKLVDKDSIPATKPRDVFIYFDNDAKVDAPRDAVRLREILAGGV